jgi:replicative DNA helicase
VNKERRFSVLDIQIPHDIELERYLVGAMLYDPACIAEITDIIKPIYFYNSQYRALCQAILELWSQNEQQVSLVELVPTIERENMDISHIHDVICSIPSTGAIRFSAERLKYLAALRAAMREAQEFIRTSHSLKATEDIRLKLNNTATRFATISETMIEAETMISAKEIALRFDKQLEDNRLEGKRSGISTGFSEIDKLMPSGLEPGTFNVVAGRPSMGKTAFALQLALNISITKRLPCAFFSLEMSGESLIARMIANEGHIDLELLKNANFKDIDTFQRYTQAMGKIAVDHLVIDDQSAMTLTEMKAKARRVKREQGLACIFIDYLGLVEGEGKREYEVVTKNSRGIKNMAKELNVPIICLAQLSREVEKREDKRPMMSDLRESGHIEQDADMIAMLYRDEYYNAQSKDKNIAEVIVVKQRNGPTGSVKLGFNKQYGNFFSLARREET